MEGDMKEAGKEMLDMEKGLNYILMEINIKVNFKMEKLMELELIVGGMAKFMKVNGVMVLEMVKVSGRELVVKMYIWETGSRIELRDMVLTLGQMVIGMMGNG
jgi:hypothetical protein